MPPILLLRGVSHEALWCLANLLPKENRKAFSSVLLLFLNEEMSSSAKAAFSAASTLQSLVFPSLKKLPVFLSAEPWPLPPVLSPHKDTNWSGHILTGWKLLRWEAFKTDLWEFKIETSANKLPWTVKGSTTGGGFEPNWDAHHSIQEMLAWWLTAAVKREGEGWWRDVTEEDVTERVWNRWRPSRRKKATKIRTNVEE